MRKNRLHIEPVPPEGLDKYIGIEGVGLKPCHIKGGGYIGYFDGLDEDVHWVTISEQELHENHMPMDGQKMGEPGRYKELPHSTL